MPERRFFLIRDDGYASIPRNHKMMLINILTQEHSV
jgi:hypothetical protein